MRIAIVGAGEVGFHIANHLARENKDVVLIDQDADALRRISDALDVQTVLGSGSSPLTLEEAGIKEAEILLAVTNSDDVNLVACLVTNIISPSTRKLARLRDSSYDNYHETFRTFAPYIDTVINPEIEVVRTIDRLMSVPGAVDVGEFADGRVKFVGVRLDESARLAGVRLADIPSRIGRPGPLIAALVREEEMIIPRGDDSLEAGDDVYFVSEESTLLHTLAVFDKEYEPIRKMMIIGGGSIGLRLAALLEERSYSIKIVEKNAQRCEMLADRLNKAVVLHGDGSDQLLLSEENIQEMDLVVALTNDEEINIVASLLAKRMGAKKAITKISKFSYLPLMNNIGLEKVVSPRLSAINSILQHIRRGKVLSAISIQNEQAEVIEAEALETSDIVSRPLKDIHLPKGILVTSILRGDRVIIPSGASVIEPGDRIVLFVHRNAVSKLEKFLAVKLEYF